MDIVQLVAIADIRVSEKQVRKVARDKISHHQKTLNSGEELYPIDLHGLGDGTYTIAGNGRHRYFSYVCSGYSHIPAIVR